MDLGLAEIALAERGRGQVVGAVHNALAHPHVAEHGDALARHLDRLVPVAQFEGDAGRVVEVDGHPAPVVVTTLDLSGLPIPAAGILEPAREIVDVADVADGDRADLLVAKFFQDFGCLLIVPTGNVVAAQVRFDDAQTDQRIRGAG